MVQQLVAEVVVDTPSEHAEGPLWSAEDGALLWVDQYWGRVLRAVPGGSAAPEVVAEVGGPIGAIVPAAGGGWAVAANDGFALLGRDGALAPVADVLPDDGIARRMNDGKCDADGAFWAGSIAFGKQRGVAALYRLRDGVAEEMLSGLTISNGLAWSADDRSFFFTDTPEQTVRRFAFSPSGDLVDPVEVVRIDPDVGSPDGMCIDREGTLWVAVWGAGAVHRYAPTGELLARVEVAAPQVSSCCFGGEDLRTLFITTSREGYGDRDVAAHPTAGSIFAVDTDAHGLLPQPYRG
ncbi:SMP-30/gluconolactonase/LRE family protein [uncultured Amnibacterium sp.]|uniref:SMP-30/gluconolactonase/LRE family protein n=1 Tax=uncultured Amnibacterium sp. TaxID=1631851 RepID=UPI0035CB386B